MKNKKEKINFFETIGALTVGLLFMYLAVWGTHKIESHYRISCERKALQTYFKKWSETCTKYNYVSEVCALGSMPYPDYFFADIGKKLKKDISKCN